MRSFIKITAAFFIAMMLFSCVLHAQTPGEDSLKKGIEYSQQGRNDEALAEFDKVIAANPASADAYYNRGFVYYRKGSLDQAIADCSKAIEIDPASSDAYYNRGLAYYKRGSFDKAIADYNKVLEISPDAMDALYGRGLAYYKKNDIKQAIADYNKVIEMRPEFPLAYSARAVAYFSKKDYGRTLADVNKAVALGFRSRPLKKAPEKAVEEKIVEKVVVVEKAPAKSSAARDARRSAWAAKRRMTRITIAVLAVLLAICLIAIFVLFKIKKTARMLILPLLFTLLLPLAADARVIEECIYLVPAGKIDKKVMEKVKEKLPGVFPMSTKVVIDPARELPQAAYDNARRQYDAEKVIDEISQQLVLTIINERALIITDQDLYGPGVDFVFGLADAKKGICIVSLARLGGEFYGQKPDGRLLAERVLKEAARQLGRSWKLPDCPSQKCVMHPSSSPTDIDKERESFCYKCGIALENRSGSRGLMGKK
jgi:predicted Zn-dependent protease/Tfp pilus assembly protein PilF